LATPQFPESAEQVQSTLARVLELKGDSGQAQLVRMAAFSIEYTDHDNYDGGVDYFTAEMRIPLEVFVQIEPALEEREQYLAGICKSVWRDYDATVLYRVRISPDRAEATPDAEAASPPRVVPDFWTQGGFRLFVSHCHSQRAAVAQLKAHLAMYGVSAFVAHDDIEPSALWQTQIELALRTCEGLVAVMSSDFATSLWCDQEVGWALGRGVPVLSVQFGSQPHGFIGKFQSVPLPKGLELSSRAASLVTLLLKAPTSSVSMTNALVRAVAEAGSFAAAKAASAQLEIAPQLVSHHATTLRSSLKENSQVYGAHGVPDRITRILKSYGL
jgi:hypothetical protein